MSSSAPKAPPPVATPTVDQALIDQQTADYASKRKGRAATILAGDQSQALANLGTGSLAVKQLLGG